MMTHSTSQDISNSSSWPLFSMRQCRICGRMFVPEKLCMVNVPGEKPYFICDQCTISFDQLFKQKNA